MFERRSLSKAEIRTSRKAEKIDLRSQLKQLYSMSPKVPEIIDMPEMNFIMVDGSGDPNISKQFQDALNAVYSISYTLKFMIKRAVNNSSHSRLEAFHTSC